MLQNSFTPDVSLHPDNHRELLLKETWLRYFITVAETGNVLESARLLTVTPDTVRRNIRELETLLGILLFQEIEGRLYPTSDGFTLLRKSQHILKSIDELSELFAPSNNPFKYQFSCGWTSIWPLYQLHGLLEHLTQKYTSVYSSTQWFNSPETIEQLLLNGALDLGLVATPPRAKNLHCLQAPAIPYVLVSAVPQQQHWQQLKYAMARKREDPPQHYQNWDYAAYPVEVVFEADSLDPVLDMALSGLAVAWLPRIVVENFLKLGWLHIVASPPKEVIMTPYVLWKKKSALVNTALDFLQAEWQR